MMSSSADNKPQKPSPIFGNQQKHGVKKPTAHVKPLKCSPPTPATNNAEPRPNANNSGKYCFLFFSIKHPIIYG